MFFGVKWPFIVAGMLGFAGILLGRIGGHSPTYEPSNQGAIAQTSNEMKSIAECAGLAFDSKLVSAHIQNAGSETHLRFPYRYLVPLGFTDGGVREGIVFQVRGDTFQPFTRTDENTPEQKKRFKEGLRDGSTVLVNIVGPDKVDTALGNIALSYLRFHHSSGTSLNGPILPNGLVSQTSKPAMGREVFIGKADGKVTDVISCSLVGRVPAPGCSHLFSFENMSISVSYPRYKLDQWRSFRDRSIKMLSCFRQLT